MIKGSIRPRLARLSLGFLLRRDFFQSRRNNRDPGTVPTKESISRFRKSRFPNMNIRIVLGISAAALSLSLARPPAGFAQDSMQIDLDFKSGRSRDDGIRDDGIRKDTISKPPVRKIYSRKKDGASK